MHRLLRYYGTTKKILTYYGNCEGRKGLFPKEERSRLNLKDMPNYTGQEVIGR